LFLAFPPLPGPHPTLLPPLLGRSLQTPEELSRLQKPFVPGGQGCIKLGLAHAGAGLREVFPLNSADQSNPAGLVAGSRGSFRGSRGNDPRTRGLEILASWRDARTARLLVKSAPVRVRSKRGWQQFWHPFWVQEFLSAFSRWSAPFPLADHRLPAANPAGLVSESEIRTHPCRMDLKSLMQPCLPGRNTSRQGVQAIHLARTCK